MARTKVFTGIVLENDSLKVALVKVSGKKLKLLKLDRFTLLKPLENQKDIGADEFVFDELDDGDDFNLDLDSALESVDLLDDEVNLEEQILGDLGGSDDIDLELDELDQAEEPLIDVDMVDEVDAPASNEILIYNILTSIDTKRINLGLNIPAGVAIYQLLKDVNFNDVKKKDLRIIIDDRLESMYGAVKADDFYSYGIREDGVLLLSSIDEEPLLLQLINKTLSLFKGKLTIEEILPDETILLGLIKANYSLEDEGITCVIQFSELSCRILFLKGNNLWLVSPIISEGTKSKKFLNTLFSKILFQLDTGEVPNLDRLIICNNLLGESATDFFQERFPDVEVNNFTFSEDFLDPGDNTAESISAFTTAIGTAWSASKFNTKFLSGISFVPKYVSDRQKVLKLQWHGILLLALIATTFPILDIIRKDGDRKINVLENEVSIIDSQINSFSPTVNSFNRVNADLSQIQDQLELMNTLAENSITWSTNLNLINSGIDEIGTVWLTSIAVGDAPNTLELEGISRDRSSISQVAKMFSNATLLDVSSFEIREQEVFRFTYSITEIVPNTSVYTPDNLQGLENLIGN